MKNDKLLSVEQALQRIVANADPIPARETLPLTDCLNRFLAEDVIATRSQPPFRASAMDGYALRSGDISKLPQDLKLVGTSAAGQHFSGKLNQGEAIRIFTGAPVPEEADAVVMQEDTQASDSTVTILQFSPGKRHIREAGVDFTSGQVLLRAGQKLESRRIGLAAAAGQSELSVVRKPKVAILATGDELVRPGEDCRADQIYSSNSYSLYALFEDAGAEIIDLGIVEDTLDSLEQAVARVRELEADIFVTMGGISVGDRDLVQPALLNQGMTLDFWKVAVKPGKPLMFGRLDKTLLFGLPGNPVSAFVTGLLFVLPAIRSMLGVETAAELPTESCLLGTDLPANGGRQDHLRAILKYDANGFLTAIPLPKQDSSLLSVLADADALIVRKPDEPEAAKGSLCRILRL